MITIAHKIKTILDMDMILVLDQGQIKEYDSPQNLLANPNSIFSEICKVMNDSENWFFDIKEKLKF